MRKHRSSASDKRTKKTFVFLDQLLEIMSGDVRSGASVRRIYQMKDKSLKQQIVVTDKASFQNHTLSRFGRLDLQRRQWVQLRTTRS